MPKQITEYRVLIISPGDMDQARNAVREAIADWNAHVGAGKDVRLEAVGWESHTHPATGAAPQDTINEQIVDDCDIGVALFGSRMGLPTPTAASGSVEEIERLTKRGAPVLIYRSTEAIKVGSLDISQLDSLRTFLDGIKPKALLGDFERADELRHLVTLHLTKTIDQTLQKANPPPTANVAQPPDIRVDVNAAMPMPEPADHRLKAVFNVTIENHSPSTFFFANYYFELTNKEKAQPLSDALTFVPITSRELESGDSLSFTASATVLMQQAAARKAQVRRAVVVDKIGRKFFSTEESIQRAIGNATVILKTP